MKGKKSFEEINLVMWILDFGSREELDERNDGIARSYWVDPLWDEIVENDAKCECFLC